MTGMIREIKANGLNGFDVPRMTGMILFPDPSAPAYRDVPRMTGMIPARLLF